jgi:hypothetical protein
MNISNILERTGKCVAVLLIGVLSIPFIFFFSFFLSGPLIYYLVFFDDSDLNEKYIREGVRVSGCVIKRWEEYDSEGSPIYWVIVMYKAPLANESNFYTTKIQVISDVMFSQTELELMVLPGYPKSARLYENLPLRKGKNLIIYFGGLAISFGGIAGFNFMGTFILLQMFLPMLNLSIVVPIIVIETLLSFAICYFLARYRRDVKLRQSLYGAAQYPPLESNEPVPQISYTDLFPSSKNTFQKIILQFAKDFLSLVGGILLVAYFVSLGGGYWLMHALVTRRKQRLLLAKYEVSGSDIIGHVVYRGFQRQYVRVRYDIFNMGHYERVFAAPTHVEGNNPMKRETVTVEQDPHLIVLQNLPCSARLSNEVELRDKIYRTGWEHILASMIFMAIQTWVWCFFLDSLVALNIFAFAGLIVATQLVFGFIVAHLYYHCFKHSMMYNAREIVMSNDNPEEGSTESEMEDDSAFEFMHTSYPELEVETELVDNEDVISLSVLK